MMVYAATLPSFARLLPLERFQGWERGALLQKPAIVENLEALRLLCVVVGLIFHL